jgi:hypothetical protein
LISYVYPFPPYEESEDGVGQEIEKVAQVLKTSAPEGVILSSIPVVAVAAGREVLPGSELGRYSVSDGTTSSPPSLTSLGDIRTAVKMKKPSAIVLKRSPSSWNYMLGVPGLRTLPRRELIKLEARVKKGYRLTYESEIMDVLIPK